MNEPLDKHQEDLAKAVRRRAEQAEQGAGNPSVARSLGQIGMIGWQIVVPWLLGLAAGRWLDHHWGHGIFWTAALMVAGLVLGCWSAWRWVQRQ
ncbi:MAG: AtpZ/AtpI family protein [Hydrogenophaga sp.]|nr:AtpZ/AtpI family protein [Hydrogenophaga sp.]